MFINYNGKLFEENIPIITADNRSLRYGDGIFETIKFKDNQLILIDEHLARLWKGMQALGFDIHKLFSPDYIEDQMLALVKKNNLVIARVRLNIFRGSGGLYDAKNNHPNFIIETFPLKKENDLLNENGLELGIYRDAKKTIDSFSNLKHNNFLPYVMGAVYAKQHKCNDALILNSSNNICDSTIANIFMIKDEIIYTPALSEGCVAGVMRDFVIKNLIKNNFSVKETAITEEMLLGTDEIFLTNSIFNIRWVKNVGDKTYTNTFIKKICNFLLDTSEI